MDTQSSESQKVFGREAGRRGQCWDTADAVSETLFVLNLISLVALLGSLISTKIFEHWSQYGESIFKSVLSYVTPPAQQTGANICCAPTTEVALVCITKEGLAVLRTSPNRALQAGGGCP